jgi:TolB-like protein/Tfp pilus assembly protein PilF
VGLPSLIGRVVTHYRIVAELGRGGMGVVYRAEDTRLHRAVAVKFLPDEVAPDAGALARFEREARAASALDHPNICTIYDVGEYEGRPFIVMALLEGQTLRHRLGSRLTVDDALGLALQIVDGLDAAHAKGIIHRDIKPANLFLTNRGEVKILDFGLARRAAERGPEGAAPAGDRTTQALPAELTSPGQAIGTVAYMSPEQARGEPLDARSDLFSAGAVLYELFTGRRAFDGETMAAVFASLLERMPPPARQINRDLPPGIEAILAKALEKDRRLRYQSVADLRADLGRVRRDRSSQATAAAGTVTAAAGRPTRRLATAVAIGAIALAGSAAWWAMSGAPIDSIAVLPFANTSGDPDAEYLSDGLTDSLINALSQVQGLRVVSRSTMFRYKGRTIDPHQAGRELGVRAVLSGRVTQRGDTLVVGADLVEVSSDSTLWGDTYDRRISDLLTIQSDIARAIFENLRVRLSRDDAQRLTTRSTTSTEALNLYYRGLHHRQKTTEEGFHASIRYFQQAVDLDPAFPLAYVGLSDSYGSLGYLELGVPGEVWPRARAAAEAALALDPSLAEAHAARGHAILRYDWNPDAAKAALDRAIELNPRYAIGHHWYAHYLMAYASGQGVLVESRKAVDLEPGDLMLNAHLFFMQPLPAQAEQLARDVRHVEQIDPDFWAVHAARATLHGHRKDFDSALRALDRGVELSGELPLALQSLGLFHAARGNRREAERVIARLEQRPYAPPYYIANIYRRLGDTDRTLEWLERGFAERDGAMIDLNTWRSGPRVEDIRARMRASRR